MDGPHFHAIGYGWIEDVRTGLEKDGWVVWNLGLRHSVYSTALYVLSHAGRPQLRGSPPLSEVRVPDDDDETRFKALAVTWFGTLSYNKMPRDKKDEKNRPRWCEICQKEVPDDEWWRVELLGEPPPDRGKMFVAGPSDYVVSVDDFELGRRYGPLARDARQSGLFKVRPSNDDE